MKICSFQLCVVSCAVSALAGLWAAPADAEIYRCETETGGTLYQNSPGGRNCRKLDMQPLVTIPAPAGALGTGGGRAAGAPGAASGSASGSSGGTTAGGSGAGGSSAGTAPGASPAGGAGGLRVDAATQRARDSDRRRIIEDELRREEQRLADVRREFNNGEPERRADERNYQKYLDRVEQLKADLARSEGNVASLRRELGALRD